MGGPPSVKWLLFGVLHWTMFACFAHWLFFSSKVMLVACSARKVFGEVLVYLYAVFVPGFVFVFAVVLCGARLVHRRTLGSGGKWTRGHRFPRLSENIHSNLQIVTTQWLVGCMTKYDEKTYLEIWWDMMSNDKKLFEILQQGEMFHSQCTPPRHRNSIFSTSLAFSMLGQTMPIEKRNFLCVHAKTHVSGGGHLFLTYCLQMFQCPVKITQQFYIDDQ